jgi:hypothetical protein
MSDESRPCYAAKCSGCGHVVGLTLDEPQYRKDVAKQIAKWIRRGLVIERMTAKEGRALFDLCTCNANNAAPLPLGSPLGAKGEEPQQP